MTPEFLLPDVQFYADDCLKVMPELEDHSVSLILTDLPYGTTSAPWDAILPFDVLWEQWGRLLKPQGAVVMTASQPFTSMCVNSKRDWFRCEWIWDKAYPSNFALANKHPLKIHESVLVFGPQATLYNPQKTKGPPLHGRGKDYRNVSELRGSMKPVPDDFSGNKFPQSILHYPRHATACKWHSTQKPVPLFEYLIKTYSNPGDMVLDCCAGSGTTGIAAARCGRKAILIENTPKYINNIRERFKIAHEKELVVQKDVMDVLDDLEKGK